MTYLTTFYHINYSVIQGFPAPRKTVTTHVKNTIFFYVCWYRQSGNQTRHSPFAPLGQVDEWTAKPSPFSVQGSLSEFSRIMAAGTLKNPYRLQIETFKLSKKGRKTNIRKGKVKVMYSAALVIAFLAAKNENRQLEDLPRADLAVYLKDYSVGKDKVNERENFVNWKLHNHCFCNHESTHISILSLSGNVLHDLFGNCRFLYFHSLIKSAFSFRPRPCSTSPLPFFSQKPQSTTFRFF